MAKMANMFSNAKVVVKAQKAKGQKNDVPSATIEGIRTIAAVRAVTESLKAVADIVEMRVKSKMADIFVERGIAKGGRPANFVGIDGDASASCQTKLRDSRRALTDEEIPLLVKHEIPYATEVLQEETFRLNPKYAGDEKLLNRISKACREIKGGVPDDLFEKVPAESRNLATKESIEAIFTLKGVDKETMKLLLNIVSTSVIAGAKIGTEKKTDREMAMKVIEEAFATFLADEDDGDE